MAADQGDERAQYNIGVMYEKGRGIPQNYKTAVKWFTLSGKSGFASAQYKLGVMNEKGRGVPQNYMTAAKWYTLAAEQGNTLAQYNLGIMYAKGRGVIKDNVYAHMWWNIAASFGHKDASKKRDMVAKRITQTQLEQALNLARECVRKKYKEC